MVDFGLKGWKQVFQVGKNQGRMMEESIPETGEIM